MKTTIGVFSSLLSCFYSKLLPRVGSMVLIVNPLVIAVLVSFAFNTLVLSCKVSSYV
jgi:hypothetical protein